MDTAAITGNEVETAVLSPSEWSVDDVVDFLKINDCCAYSENFIKQVSIYIYF